MSPDDLKKIFDQSIGSTKAYFIIKVQQKYPRLDKKNIEAWLKSQEVVQINTKVKGINLKITAKPRTFQIDIMYYKIGQSLKPCLLLVDIMRHKAFCYSIPGEKNMTKIITVYNKFLKDVDYVKSVEGDGKFDNTSFKKLNEEKGIQVYTSVVKVNHFTSGNKLDIIDRLTRTLKENIRKYRASAGTLGNLQNIIDTVVKLYNDSPHRGIGGKTPNQMWDNTKEQEKRNIIDTMSNDKIFNKLTLGIGDDVHVLENKDNFDKGNAQFSQEIYEIHDRIGYSYKVKDVEGSVKRRRYKPHELLVVDNVTSSLNTDRMKRDEKGASKYKTVNKLIRNEDMTRAEACKTVKGMETNVLGPTRNTRTQAKTTRSQTRTNNVVVPARNTRRQTSGKVPKRKPVPAIDVDELLRSS
jgi:hypothetical protein